MTIIDRRGLTVASEEAAADAEVDVGAGLAIKSACRAATTANITLNGQQTIDGVAVVAGDRVLVKSQTDQTQNGVYVVSTGNWARSSDFNETGEVLQGTQVLATAGTVNGGRAFYISTANPIVIDATNIAFVTFGAQPLDATLTALAALDTSAGLLVQTGADTFTKRTLTGTTNEITITNGSGAAGNPTVSLAPVLDLTGKTVTVATQSQADDSTKAASTGYVRAAITTILGGVASAFDTLSEIATELALKAASAVTLTAGAGLTGGGTLAANRTFTVGAGTGIVVNADDVAIDTGNLPGVATNSAAAAGKVGEYTASNIAVGSAVALTTGTTANVASLSLTAGDWDVWIQPLFTCGASTNVTFLDGQITTTSATLGTLSGLTTSQVAFGAGTVIGAGAYSIPGVTTRFSLASTTTVYFVAQATFTISTCAAWGAIQARRVR